MVAGVVLVASACGSSGDTDAAGGAQQPSPTVEAPTATLAPSPTASPTAEVSSPAQTLCAVTSVASTDLEPSDLVEASGLVASRTHLGVHWSHNDSGNRGGVHAFDRSGSDLGFFAFTDDQTVDPEDLALAPSADGSGDDLFLADIGDNGGVRDTVTVLRFPEPDPSQAAPITDVVTASYRYPDRPHDAEALVVDAANGELVIITKEIRPDPDAPEGSELRVLAPARVFVGPLPGTPGASETVTLTDAGELDVVGLVTRSETTRSHPLALIGVAGAVTAADLVGNDQLLAVRTYGTVWLWDVAPGRTAAEVLVSDAPCEAMTATDLQGEAVALLDDGSALLTIGEGKRPMLHRTD